MWWLTSLSILAVILLILNNFNNLFGEGEDSDSPRLQQWRAYKALKDKEYEALDKLKADGYGKGVDVRPVFQGRGRLFREGE